MKTLRKSTQRNKSNPVQSHTYNEAKYKILMFIYRSGQYFSPEEIAKALGLTPGSVRTRLSKMTLQGYIWRKKEYRIRKNPFCYGFLKPMGIRVLIGTDRYTGLIKRMEMRQVTGDNNITLNLKEEPSEEQKEKYERLLAFRETMSSKSAKRK